MIALAYHGSGPNSRRLFPLANLINGQMKGDVKRKITVTPSRRWEPADPNIGPGTRLEWNSPRAAT
jgi:hypothetical protein